MSKGNTNKLTDAFLQSSILQIACGGGSKSIDLPDDVKTFVVTNPTESGEAWVCFGTKDASLTAVVGLGHHLAGGSRLIVEKTLNVAKVAAIAGSDKNSQNLVIYVECGEGGLNEKRGF